jgi:nitrate reductase gamma subunit
MSGSTLVVVSYVLLAIFAVAFLVRSIRLARMPVHLRWELSPVPHEKGKAHYGGSYLEEYEWWTKPREKSLVSEFSYMFQEIAFLKAVWEHNRPLWWFSLPFHNGLYLLIGAVGLLVLGAILELAGVAALSWTWLRSVILVVGGAGYGLGAVGALGLIVKRLFDPKLRDFSPPVTVFNLVLLLATFGTGLWAMASVDYFGGFASFFGALLRADTSIAVPTAMGAHLVVGLIFLAYLPFTQMMHFVAKYFTYHEVRWNDEPIVVGGRLEKKVKKLLDQPVTWAGPHVHADGKKTWVDIATEETVK